MYKSILIILFSIFMTISCSKKPEIKKTSDIWLKEGLNYFEKGKYDKAIVAFENSIMESEDPNIAAEAQLFLADSHFFLEEYNEAIPSYEEYLNIYPDSKYAKQALYRLGLCYYKQIDTVDRDQSNTKKALLSFKKLAIQYPEYAKSVNIPSKIKELRNMLAEKEYYVAKFYLRIKKYKAAENRFKTIMKKYADTDIYPKAAIDYAEYIINHTNKKANAIPVLTSALKNKNSQKYFKKVSKILGKLQKELKIN